MADAKWRRAANPMMATKRYSLSQEQTGPAMHRIMGSYMHCENYSQQLSAFKRNLLK